MNATEAENTQKGTTQPPQLAMKPDVATEDVSLVCMEDMGLQYKGSAKPLKAYDNRSFLHSRGARHLRIMCEYLETQQRLRNEEVLFSLLFFGSARAQSHESWEQNRQVALTMIANGEEERGNVKLERLKRVKWMCEYYEKARELARMITAWSFSPEGRETMLRLAKYVPSPVTLEGDEARSQVTDFFSSERSPLVICTGGAGGLMEAANRGASEAHPLARSMGMGISLPFESGINPWVTDNLSFEFHYFFTRKFWMVYIALGLVVSPGGVGTLDEMFEFLTLKQTGKIKRHTPMVLLGKEFWTKVINFPFLVERGVIDADDISNILFTDDPKEAFDFIKESLTSEKMATRDHKWVQRLGNNKAKQAENENRMKLPIT